MEAPIKNTANTNKHKTLWYGLGTLALGTLTFFGIKHFTKPKNETTDDNTTKTNPPTDIKTPIKNHTKPAVHSILPAASTDIAFPIKMGAKGDSIRKLQQSLITSYGAGVFKKYGADGYYGKQLEAVLKEKGYALPLSESDYHKITQEKKAEVIVNTDKPLFAFNPIATAFGIYSAIVANDFFTAITLLKGISNTDNYSASSEQFKIYRINGVRQTLVNAMLSSFKTINQKIIIQSTLKNIGLKYDGDKWSI